MSDLKARKVTSKSHPDDYVNKETGELLSSERPGVSVLLRQDTGQFVMNTKEYVTFSSEAMEYLAKELSTTDIGKIHIISNMVKGDCSIISQNNNLPHTPNTLCYVLDMDISRFYEFIRKLVRKNILAYAVCAPSGYLERIYMLNPYIARKRKTFNKGMMMLFRDITKDPPELISPPK